MSIEDEISNATTLAPAGVVTARTPRGETILLVTDPDGEYIVVEQLPLWLGADDSIVAHRLAPVDFRFLRDPNVTRYARLA